MKIHNRYYARKNKSFYFSLWTLTMDCTAASVNWQKYYLEIRQSKVSKQDICIAPYIEQLTSKALR